MAVKHLTPQEFEKILGGRVVIFAGKQLAPSKTNSETLENGKPNQEAPLPTSSAIKRNPSQ